MVTFKEFLINEADMDQEEASTANASQLSNEARNLLKTGVRRLLRLDHPQQGETEKSHAGRTADAFDILEALEVIRKFFEDTEDMMGKKFRKGDEGFDYVSEIKKDIEEFYLSGATEKEGALNRRKYRVLVNLLLDPIVDLFRDVPHEEALKLYDGVIDNTIRYVKNSDVVANADDAFVTRRLIQKEVQRRNRVTKTVDGIHALRQKAAAKGK